MNLPSDQQRMKRTFVDEKRIWGGLENVIQAQGCKIVPDLIRGGIVCSIYDYVLGSQSHFYQETRGLLFIHVLSRLLTNTAW